MQNSSFIYSNYKRWLHHMQTCFLLWLFNNILHIEVCHNCSWHMEEKMDTSHQRWNWTCPLWLWNLLQKVSSNDSCDWFLFFFVCICILHCCPEINDSFIALWRLRSHYELLRTSSTPVSLSTILFLNGMFHWTWASKFPLAPRHELVRS